MATAPYTFRLATEADRQGIVDFMNTHWETRHPLINLPDFFDFYYKPEDGTLRFALAEEQGALRAIAGFVPASQRAAPDIWVSIWVADKAAKGCGLELMAALPALTGCRTLACNNIRPNTRPFYEFLGYTTGQVGCFYRLAAQDTYTLAQVPQPTRLPVSGSATLTLLPTEAALHQSGFVPPSSANPYKDVWYIARRYYHYPRQQYRVYAAALPGDSAPRALLVLRVIPVSGTCVLRIADYIGSADFLPQLGRGIDQLMAQEQAEYTDFYCAGLDPDLLRQAGFTQRIEGDGSIIPHYLTPLLVQNTDFYYFTSRPEGFTLFKGDGDQDRPNIDV